MKGGNPNDFLEEIFNGVDTVYVYKGIKYWGQGYTIPTGWHYEIYQHEPFDPIISNQNMWEFNGKDQHECLQTFIKAPIFNGLTFWQAEQDIEWVDY